jgi:pyruvate dehydrogenase E2 component (dihydrolipoamide acetyltransferase)
MAGVKQPADKSHFILPDLGEGVAEAELLEWKVKPGDSVAEHQTLAEMETDKARVEVPSPWKGVIKELKGAPGDIIKVGATLVTYDVGKSAGSSAAAPSAGQKLPAASKSATPEPKAVVAATSKKEEREDAGTVVGSVGGTITISDRFARRAEHGESTNGKSKALATPAVRRIARELGVDINRVPGSGRGGRVTAGDVQDVAERGAAAPAKTRAASGPRDDDVARPVARPASGVDGVSQRIPFRGIRRKIAQALRHSVSTTVHFTVVEEADVTALDQKRKELSFATGEKLSMLPFIMAAVCRALKEHPALNANVDDQKEEIILRSVVNLGCAVDTEHGLMVPVLVDADRDSIVALSRRVADVAARCHARSIPREELIGGTFTISNVGSYGGLFATPIINYPEVGILAAGRARDQVLAKHGGFFVGKVLPLSLSCDHRVVDGAEGTRFLNTVVKYLETPERLLKP